LGSAKPEETLDKRLKRPLCAWPGIADSITVMGGDHAFVIKTDNLQRRVVTTPRGMVCPRCHAGCYALVFRAAWPMLEVQRLQLPEPASSEPSRETALDSAVAGSR
jgi:hypothetical protein